MSKDNTDDKKDKKDACETLLTCSFWWLIKGLKENFLEFTW